MARPENPIGCRSYSWKVVLNKFLELKAKLKVTNLKLMKLKRREAKLKLKIENSKHDVLKLDVIEVLSSKKMRRSLSFATTDVWRRQKVKVPMWIKGYEFNAIADLARDNLFNLVRMNSKRKRN